MPEILDLLRAPAAADYLKANFGFGSPRTLAKLRTLGGGPSFRKIGRLVVYEKETLRSWGYSKLSTPLGSTSEASAQNAT